MYKIFSVDDHVVEHPLVWTSRLPQKYFDVAPHVVNDGTQEFWQYEDQQIFVRKLSNTGGRPREEWGAGTGQFTDMIPGAFDPEERAKNLISQGVLASVAFPSFPRFGGMLFTHFKDKELASLCVQAWNDFILDEWCPAGPPGMFVPMIICQVWDPGLAAKEITRCLAKGAKALCFVENPVPDGLPSFHTDHWDPIWSVCEEARLPVCMHVGSSGFYPGDPASSVGTLISGGNVSGILAAINMLTSPVCFRFPEIKLVWSEAGIGWIPSVLERADRTLDRHSWENPRDLKPSEIFRRNMYACMIEEPIGLSMWELIGADRILAETDFPHPDTTFPDVQGAFKEVFHGVPQDVVKMVSHTNAEKLFDWEMADEALIQPTGPWVPPVTIAPPGIRHIDGTDLPGCGVLVKAGNGLVRCAQPVGTDGVCAQGHAVG